QSPQQVGEAVHALVELAVGHDLARARHGERGLVRELRRPVREQRHTRAATGVVSSVALSRMIWRMASAGSSERPSTYDAGSGMPSMWGQSEPNSVRSKPRYSAARDGFSSQNGDTHTWRRNVSLGRSLN